MNGLTKTELRDGLAECTIEDLYVYARVALEELTRAVEEGAVPERENPSRYAELDFLFCAADSLSMAADERALGDV